METHELLDGEEIISQSNNNLITLTNYRLRYTDSSWGHSLIVSLLLEKISSIHVKYESKPIFIWMALAAHIAAFALFHLQDDTNYALAAGGIGALCGIIYFASRQHTLVILANGPYGIHFRTSNMAKGKILLFINGLEKAVFERQNQLHESKQP